MAVFLTVVAGFATFSLGQIAVKLVIDPVQEFKKVVADISHAVIEYANVYSNPGIPSLEVQKKVSEELRKLSSRLNAQMYLVPYYPVTVVLFGLPRKARVVEAARYLIGLSNSVFESAKNQAITNVEKSEKLCDVLGIHVHEGDRISPKKGKQRLVRRLTRMRQTAPESKLDTGKATQVMSRTKLAAWREFNPNLAPLIIRLQFY